MSTVEPQTQGDLARLGLGGAAAVPDLRALGAWGEDGPTAAGRPALRALAAAPSPADALRGLSRLADARPSAWELLAEDEELVRRAATIASASDALVDLLATSPSAVEVLCGDLAPRGASRVAADVAAALDDVEPQTAPARLAEVQRLGLLRCAARDLLGAADTPTVAGELAELAEGVLRGALTYVGGDDGGGLAVIGMGKLGGRELNYVSDVDVIFVADGDWTQATRTAERLLRLLGAPTPFGRAYEIDTNLRPEGRDGNLVRTLDGYRSYYERWSKTWELQALLKARFVAGDEDLGRRFAELVEPFLWPDRLDAAKIAEIQGMKEVVERSPAVQRVGTRQLKLAPGGLRDIEFAVQLLQLVHGRHDPSLRSPTTLTALAALAEGGYVDEADAELFADAYRFLRTVEHRIQLVSLRRTHTIPADEEQRARLARNLGFRDLRTETALEQLDREHQRVSGHTRRLHEKLFYRPLLERFAEVTAADRVGVAGGLDERSAFERLQALGFSDPAGALSHLQAMASGVSRRARLFRTLLPALLPTLAAAPDPDGGLASFRSLAERLGETQTFLRTLRDNPPVGQLLARVLGASSVVGRWLERQPEVVSALADLPRLAEPVDVAGYRRLADGLLRRGDDLETAGAALRRMKRREVARIAVRDLAGYADVPEVGAELSGVAEACLEAAIALVTPPGVRMAAIAMGKLGGRELGYASDLDLLLVYEPQGEGERAAAAAEQLLRLLAGITPEGKAFHVDLDLRPEGKDGVLARTLEGYRSYYERWGQTWELQALTQARPAAGDPELGAAFVDLIRPLVYPADVPAERLQAVRRMKARVERERSRAGEQRSLVRRGRPRAMRPGMRKPTAVADRGGPGDRVDLKLGPGGLADVEWTVQLLQLAHGAAEADLRRPGTLAALDAAQAHGLLSPEDAAWLREGWLLQSRLRNGLYLLGAADTSTLPAGGIVNERLARLLGLTAPGAQKLHELLRQAQRRVRKVHERVFYGS